MQWISKEFVLQKCIFLVIYFQEVHSKSFFPRHFCTRFCILRHFCKGVISLQWVFSKSFFCKVFLQSRLFFCNGFFQRVFFKVFLQSFFFQNIFFKFFFKDGFFSKRFFFPNCFTKKISLQGVIIFFQGFFKRRLSNHGQ